MIYYPSWHYYLVHLLLTNPGSCNQYPVITAFLIHDFSKWVTGISSWVTINDYIHDPNIIVIIPSSFRELPEFSLRDPLHMFNVFGFRTIICHNICRFSSILMYLMSMYLSSTMYLIELRWISMCLVCIPYFLFFTMNIALWLSSYTTDGFYTSVISPSNMLEDFTYCAHANRTTYYASVLLNVTVLWFFDEHVISDPPSVATRPLTFFLVSLSVA